MTAMRWHMSNRADPAARVLADRHYSRQSIGAQQFVAAGSCVVFLTGCGRAFWVTGWQRPEFTKHAWPGAWVNAAFRSEGAGVASDLIRQAIAATRAHYGEPPALGMVTMIDTDRVRPTKVRGRDVWGWTYRKVGFVDAGKTAGGLLVLQLSPHKMPSPIAALPRSMLGTPLFDEAIA